MECVMWLFIDVQECLFKIHVALLLLLSSFICWLFSGCLTFKDLQISSLNDLTSHLSGERKPLLFQQWGDSDTQLSQKMSSLSMVCTFSISTNSLGCWIFRIFFHNLGKKVVITALSLFLLDAETSRTKKREGVDEMIFALKLNPQMMSSVSSILSLIWGDRSVWSWASLWHSGLLSWIYSSCLGFLV